MSLENLLEFKANKDNLKARKLTDLPRFALIKGAKSCGKKSLVFNLLDDFLYIDMLDFRLNDLSNLDNFIKSNKITNLVINEYDKKFTPLNEIKNCYILSSSKDYHLDDFIEINLNFLDYEEFITFSKKNYNENMFLSSYLLLGQNPMNVDKDINELVFNYQKLLKESLNNIQIKALCLISNYIGHQISILSLHKEFQQFNTISKNDFFKLIYKLENEYYLYWIKHFNKNLKKPYFCDFAIKNALNYKKDFNKNYENLIANELLMIYDEIFYNDDFHFIIKDADLAIICDAFALADFIKLKAKKIAKNANDIGISRVLILSLNTQSSYNISEVRIEVMKLNSWLLSKELNDWD